MKLTSRQLRRIIAEEVSRVIAEATGSCSLVKLPSTSGMFVFKVGDEELDCEMGRTPEDTAKEMQACAEEAGLGPLDEQECLNVADEVHGENYDMGDPDSSALGMRGLRGNPPEIGAIGRRNPSQY